MRNRNTAVIAQTTITAVFVGLMILKCAHTDGVFEQVEGRYFPHEKAEAIVDGRTSEEDVEVSLGAPFEKSIDSNGVTTMRYYSVRRRENVEKGLFSTRKHWQKWTQELVVRTRNHRVIDHSYTAHTEEG